MATFVLVHGAWHGGWCWTRVAKRLRAAGHEVFTPTLTGVGERTHLAGMKIDLSLHIHDICAVLEWERLTDVILVGHSYGGMVITGVVEAMPQAIRSLVYLDAFVPTDGMAAWDFLSQAHHATFLRTAAENGGATAPVPAAAFNVNAADQAWVDELCRPMALACLIEKLRAPANHAATKPRTFIYAAGRAPSAFTPIYERVRSDPAWTVATSPAGHDVMVDDPEGLTATLLRAA